MFYDLLSKKTSNTNNKKVIRNLRKKCSKIELIVIKQSNKGICLGNSRPCCMCLNFMKVLKFKGVYYSINNTTLAYEKIYNMESLHISQIGRM